MRGALAIAVPLRIASSLHHGAPRGRRRSSLIARAIPLRSPPSTSPSTSRSSPSLPFRPRPSMGGMLSRLRGGGRGGEDVDRCTVSASVRRHYGLRAMDPADAGAARGDPGDESDPLWLVVGLGNPGPRYDGTRHNVGFAAVDRLAALEGIDVGKVQCNAAVGRGRVGRGDSSSRVLLAKPLTFMNVSGESVGRLAKFYRVPPTRVLVLYDDLDTAVGVTRLRQKGGHGGHNGMRSIMQHLGGTKDFPRVRLGIGRPPGTMPVAAYVLQQFDRSERESVEASIEEACDAVRAALTMGIEKAVSQRPSRGEKFVKGGAGE